MKRDRMMPGPLPLREGSCARRELWRGFSPPQGLHVKSRRPTSGTGGFGAGALPAGGGTARWGAWCLGRLAGESEHLHDVRFRLRRDRRSRVPR